jgi:NTP pyrophosphatase (non-canonical NTP hydrolase)
MNKLAQEIHANACAKGFWDQPRPIAQILMLVVCELAEAVEADREGRRADLEAFERGSAGASMFWEASKDRWCGSFKAHVKDAFEDEIADAIIRLLDLCCHLGIDIERHIALKMEYNATRERLHGKAY